LATALTLFARNQELNTCHVCLFLTEKSAAKEEKDRDLKYYFSF
jgi:hypothetical protein